ncbi:MAG: sigma-54 dependent transcriptional regulator [Methylococcaceae bacterium]|jgi:transcriptional regulator with PAS, ATPase and Fis domain
MKNIDPIIGKHPALKSLLRNVKIVAATDVNVLITGETGTGKELIAVALQKNSRRADHVFITLNCSALPVSLMESMLFGHCRGAFTGADTDKQGIFAAADGGTLFLDEINSLTLALQTKLLRFIEFGEYLPVGSVTTRIANVRLIAATNSQIDKLISAGKFRQDLYFRLSVVTLELPPLRKRPQDVSLLIEHFMSYFAKKYAVRTPSLSKEVLQVLKHYRWPGNIRELRNLCENLTISRIRRTIKLNDLPVKFRENNNTPCSIYFELPELGLDWYELEKDLIQQALKKADGNRKAAAELLAISRDALYYRIKKYGLVLT